MDLQPVEVLLRVLFGCVALLAGRNVFWLFIGLLGFLVGADAAHVWLQDQPDWATLAVAIAAGVVGAVLAMLFERVAFSLAGFYAAAFVLIAIFRESGIAGDHAAAVLVAGIAGAIFAALVMDWAIIVLSALAGAAAVVSVFAALPIVKLVSFLVLVAIGVGVQYRVMSRR